MNLFEPFATPFMARALIELIILGALAGTVGVLVLLRKLAFVTDTMTHTVFPGVVIGYLAADEGGIFWGALAAGMVTAVLLTLLTRRRKVSEDAALAMLLTSLFALGVVLVSRRSGYTADLTAFLFGRVLTVTEEQLAQTGFTKDLTAYTVGDILTVDTSDLATTAAVACVILLTFAVLGKELLLRAFDPDGAAAMGLPVALLDLALLALVEMAVVATVPALGAILTLALLVGPAATARLLSDRLVLLFPLAAAIGVACGLAGIWISMIANIAAGASIALLVGAVFAGALLLRRVAKGPRRSMRVEETALPLRPTGAAP
jgi:manganese/iron transport system permease protein